VGDLKAQIAACHTGAALFRSLVDKYGLEAFDRSLELIIANGEELARAAVRAIPDGEYYAEGFTDSDGVDVDVPLKVAVTVRVAGDEIEFDFTGTGPPCRGPCNSNRYVTKSLMQLAFKHLTTPRELANEGHFRPMRVTVPEGCLFDAQRDSPTLIGFYALELAIDLVRKALAPAIPDRVNAGDYGRCCVVHAAGISPRDGSFGIIADTEGGGWGAKPFADGENALLFGDIRVPPVEVLEHKHPVLLERYELRQDSGGIGRWRGGLGVIRDYRCTGTIHLLAAYDRSITPPFGLFGGGDAMHSLVVIKRANGQEESFMKCTGLELAAGDVMSFRTAGGGGYGEPQQREPERVASDVVDGYISSAAAERDYGCVVDANGLVDVPASNGLARAS
jgi:N-methylhydantoinase B